MHSDARSDAIRHTQTYLQARSEDQEQPAVVEVAHCAPDEGGHQHALRGAISTHSYSISIHSDVLSMQSKAVLEAAMRALMAAPSSDEGGNQHAISYARTDGSAAATARQKR